jgi:ankyrin repeat protein
MRLERDDPRVIEIGTAIRRGDLETLGRLLRDTPGLAAARIDGGKGRSRTVLHTVADWPGFFPNGAEMVRMLVQAGADVDAPTEGPNVAETALHWAASSDDYIVAEALIEAGANIEATGASIAGGTPLEDAVGYGCWQVAWLLVHRGASVDKLWHAAALGLMPRIEAFFSAPEPPTPEEINSAFFQACSGGQPRAAEYLLARGADINFVPNYAKGTPLKAATGLETRRETLATWLREHGGHE